MITVIAFGAFDLLHPGHIFYLEEASKLGDELIVVIARDKSIKSVKGKMPVQGEKIRLSNVKNIDVVDKALLGSAHDPYELIVDIKPDIIALGYDQNSFTERLEEQLKERNINAEIVRLNSFHPEHYKSSHLRRRLLRSKD